MTPYDYHNNELGVKTSFLYSDRNAHESSIRVIKYRTLRKRMDVKSSTEKELRRSCLGSEGLVLYSSICQEWKDALALKFGAPQQQIKQTYFASQYVTDKEAYQFYLKYTYGAEKKKLELSLVDEYTFNASVLNTVRLVKNNRKALRRALGGSRMDIWETLSIEVANFKEVPHTVPAASLRRTFTEYDRIGYEKLISAKLQNRNAQKMNGSIMKLLNGLFWKQTHKPTPTEVARQYDSFLSGYAEVYNTETGELYNPKEFTKLSNATVINYLGLWENKIATHAKRSGDRQKFMQKFKTYHSLDQPKFAGSIISIDDRNPPFEYSPGNRVWFYKGIDLASECFTTFVYGKTKEGLILDFYRQMVRNYTEWGFNVPHELEAEMSLNSAFTETFLKEGAMFQEVRIEANNARGKRIEAYFRPLRYDIEKKRVGWLARPFAESESNQKRSEKKEYVPYNQIIEGALKDLETWNNMEHSTEKGMSRWDYFCAKQHPNILPTNWRGILPHLGHKTKTSCNVGIIKLDHKEFLLGENGSLCFGQDLIFKMKRIEGKELDIYWLDGNDGNVLKAHIYIGNEYMGEAVAKPRYNRAKLEQTPQDLANRELMSKYVATVEGFMRERILDLEPIEIIDNTPVVLNTNFKIPGLKRHERKQEEAEDLGESDTDITMPLPTRTGHSWSAGFKL